MKLHSAHLLLGSAFLASALVFACAESASDIPGDEKKDPGAGTSTENSQTLPPSNPAGGSTSGGSTSSSGSTTSSSGSTTSSSGSTTSSSGGSSGSGSAPACSFAGDFTKLIAKAAEIQAGAPCDSTCNPATHCCLDLGAGGGGGGGSSGLPLDAGGASGSGGLPTGSGGVCVSNN